MTRQLSIACLLLTCLLASCTSPAAPTLTPAPTSPPTEAPTQTAAPTVAEQPTNAPTVAQETQVASDTATAAPTPAATDTPAASPTPAIAYMTYQDFQIVPAALTIKAGTKVVFLIKGGFGSFHQPYSSFPNSIDVSGLFEAPTLLGDGSSYSYTFNQPGTYTVRCGYHPDDMVATIEVTP